MDEEEKLTNELEAEQQQALQTAIEEEESWLKELAREENTVIDVETETETENELGVSSDPSIWSCVVLFIIFCLTSFSDINFMKILLRRIFYPDGFFCRAWIMISICILKFNEQSFISLIYFFYSMSLLCFSRKSC